MSGPFSSPCPSGLHHRHREPCSADFFLLARPFLDAIAFLFPTGLHLSFLPDPVEESGPDPGTTTLYLPLPLADSNQVNLRLHSTDPVLMAQISAQWLEEQRDNVLHILSLLRPAFIDCTNGFYNLRALCHALQTVQGTFFLLHLGCIKKNITSTQQACAKAVDLLTNTVDAIFFSCGFGLFAALRREENLESGRRSARLLQRHLRQGGISCVQVLYLSTEQACTIFKKDGLAGFQDFWATVDKQGPFGLLCASAENERYTTRFDLANTNAFSLLQKKWRGLTAFSLALFKIADQPNNQENQENTLPAEALPLAAMQHYGDIILVAPHTLACFFPETTPQKAQETASTIRQILQKTLPTATISVGIAGWPYLDYVKKNIPANCLKALLHASLLGPGQQVLFDHLSLNVSGDSYFEEGDYQQAIREYRRGLKVQPDDVNLLNSLGVTLAAYGQDHQAAACFRRALQVEADNHMALTNLGSILLHQGKDDAAFTYLQQAHAAFPASEPLPRELLQPLARLYLERRQFDQALIVLEHWAVSMTMEKDVLYYRQLGLALEGSGHREKALRAFEQALKLAPQDALSMGHLGGLYLASGEGEELGLHLCEQAVNLEQHNPVLWRLLGKAYYGLAKTEAAFEAAKQSLRLQPACAEGMLLAAKICLQKKNIPRARYWLNRAMKLHTINPELAHEITRTLAKLAKGTGAAPQTQP